MPAVNPDNIINIAFSQLEKGIKKFSFSMKPREDGLVISVSTGIAKGSGL